MFQIIFTYSYNVFSKISYQAIKIFTIKEGENANKKYVNTTLEILNTKTSIKSIMTDKVPPLFAYISFWFIKKQLVTLQGKALYNTYIDEIKY